MSTNTKYGQQAIVMGGSLGGLIAARVLSDHFDRVTIIEKDPVHHYPESRPGQPQTRHLHGLLATGLQVMTHYFPDLPQALSENGAMMNDFANSMNWSTYGGHRQRFTIGFPCTTMSRGLLEHLVRERVLALPQIQLLDRTSVKQLITTADRRQVVGVTISQPDKDGQTTELVADLVVDVTGRRSHSPQWLKDLGYEPPRTNEVQVNVRYATRIYRRDPQDPRSQTWLLSTPEAPKENRFGGIFPIEGDRWLVSVGGWHGDLAPTDERGFLEFARSLPTSDIYDIISQAEPLSEIYPYHFPTSLRRRYEKLRHFPQGYLVMGDAVSSFNPTYGQGMTVAALEAAELDRVLAEQPSPVNLAPTFFQRIAKIIDIPWQLAVGEDFRYPQTTGSKPLGINLLNLYVAKVHRATLRDREVSAAFLKVMNLMAPPASLFHPRLVWRVLIPHFSQTSL